LRHHGNETKISVTIADIGRVRMSVRSCSSLTAHNLVALLLYECAWSHLAWNCALVLLNKWGAK